MVTLGPADSCEIKNKKYAVVINGSRQKIGSYAIIGDDHAIEKQINPDDTQSDLIANRTVTIINTGMTDLDVPEGVPVTRVAQPGEAPLASTIYTVDFINSTPDTWTLAVYQTLPSSPGLVSVSWKQTTVPRSADSGVQWSIDYLVGLPDYQQIGPKGVYKGGQKLATNLGQKWAARFESGAQQLFPIGSAGKGQVIIDNQSGSLADLAIGMDGDFALVQKGVYSGNSAQFEVTPTYWVALFKDVVKGEVISGGQVHGPLQAKFSSGVTKITYKAYIDGNTFIFEDSLGQKQAVRVDEMDRRMRALGAA